MGLRCLLGHEYGNREVEREREERGQEVVVTYRTVETCDRCGERRTVSENKEVRPVRDPDAEEEAMATGLGPGGVTPDPTGGATDDEQADDGPTAADPEPEPTTDSESTVNPDAGGTADPDADATTADPEPESTADDGIILDPEDDDRGHGEWPDRDAEVTADADADGDVPVDPDAAATDDGATLVGGSVAESDGGSATVSVASEQPSDAGPADEPSTGTRPADKQFVAAEGVERVDAGTGGVTEFFCPNCGHARTADGASMRVGDICPSCYDGYIDERERE